MTNSVFKPAHSLYYPQLFYAYLLCKAKFREEMIQVNSKTGFANFNKYQDRKDLFLKGSPVFESAITSMAVQTSNLNQKIDSFETRIAPNKATEIQRIDRFIAKSKEDSIDRFLKKQKDEEKDKEKDKNHFYVLHFIKESEKRSGKDSVQLYPPDQPHPIQEGIYQ